MQEVLKIYTDSSTVDESSAATSIYVTDTRYIGMITHVYEVASATEAELLSVLQAMRYFWEEELPYKEIDIYCDCKSIVEQLRDILLTDRIPEDIKYRDKWVELFDLCKGLDINAHHVKGHQEVHNLNKVCDKLSHSVVQKLR